MATVKRTYEGRKPRRAEGFVARVTGEVRGVPFRNMYKRMSQAVRNLRPGDELLDMTSGRLLRLRAGKLVEVRYS
jgi:hypothetical protein